MALFKWKRRELRAEGVTVVEDALLEAALRGGSVDREMALQVPTVAGGVDLIAGIIAGTPIKLYRDEGGHRAVEVTDDPRLRLLNDETGDTLNANEFWHAIVRDYYLGKGGYAYIHRENGVPVSLHYVEERCVSVLLSPNPIFKDFDLAVNGVTYAPHNFLKILRNTTDGAQGVPITVESAKLIETAYATLVFERNMALRGGNKKGFLKSEKKLDDKALEALRAAFGRLYSNDRESSENFVVLNSGLEFQESSATSVELQLNENKETNAAEFAKLFHISPESIAGRATEQDTASIARLAAIPLMKAIQCALNKDLLLEKEKPTHYFAFDTKELLRGDLQGRYNAYKTALDANFLQIDEVRYSEDLEPLGLNWIKLGLQDVLYDPRSKTIFTPNTGEFRQMEGDDALAALQEPGVDATMEERGNGKNATRKKNGQFSGSTPKVPKCYRVGKREFHRLTHEIATIYPTLKPGPKRYPFENRNHFYVFSVKGFGAYEYHLKVKIEGNEEWIRMQHVALKSNEEDQG